MALSKVTAARVSYCLISTPPSPAPLSDSVALCSACVDSLGFAVAVRILRSLGAVGIFGSTSIENSQARSALHCKFCRDQIPDVRCITSSEFSI
jgi:hypothetical protein